MQHSKLLATKNVELRYTVSEKNENWRALVNLAGQIKQCDELGLTTPSIAMAFICIDTMASLARPIEKERVTRKDFIDWCDSYLKGHPEQVYQYRGKDVYAARCAFLHTYGSKADIHDKEPDVMKFVYHDGGRHYYNPSIDERLVIIATSSFTNDVISAASDFLDACDEDKALKERVGSRSNEILYLVPIKS